MSAARLIIDLDALAANWQRLDRLNSGETAATIKADGYGLGAEIVARRLAAAGVRSFFVALAEEGQAVRRAVGAGPKIYVFSGHMAGDAQLLRNLDLIPLLNSPEQVQRHIEAIPQHPFGVQLDSGMNRLGMEPDDWRAIREVVLRAGPQLIMSHLASSDEPADPMNTRQRESFAAMTAGIPVPRSLAATGGILLGREFHFDLARPGIGLYGGRPFADALPVVSLSLPVIQTRTVTPHEIVGYNGTWTARQPTRVATVAAGYADGILRSLSNKGTLWAGDTACPIVGRVSMDLITVDVTALPEVPETLDLLSAHQGVDAVADAAGTIGYEILTSLGGRYRRVLSGTPA